MINVAGRAISPIPIESEELATVIVNCAFQVHSKLGPGLLESVYEACLSHELKKFDIGVER